MNAPTESVPTLHKIRQFFVNMDAGMRRLIAIGMVETLAVSLYVSLLAPWYKSLGYESATQGWLGFVLQVTSAVVAAIGGILADRLGRKNLYTAGQLLRCAAIIVLLSTRSFAGLVIVSVIRGLAIIQSPPRTAFIAAYTVKENRATTLGIYQTMSLITNVAAPLASGFLADLYGVRVPLIVALILAAAAIFMAIPLEQPKHTAEHKSSQEIEPTEAVTASGGKQSSKSAEKFSLGALIPAGREMFVDSDAHHLVLLLIAWLANGLGNGALNILLPFTVMDRFSSTYRAITALNIFSSLGTALVLLIGGRIADLRGRKGIVIITGLMFPILMSSILWISALWQVYTMIMLVSMVGNMSAPAIMAVNIEAVDEKYRATWDGFSTGVSSLGMALGNVLGGIMYKIDYTWSWIAVITLFTIQVLCFYRVLE